MRLLPFARIIGPLIISLAVISASGQNSYTTCHYTNENGLPANGIKGLELDTISGFLWVGTQGGLVRFDGRQFKKIVSDTSEVAVSRISVICRNREGTIYCVDDNLSVYRINRNNAVYVGADSMFMPMYKGGVYPVRPPEELAHIIKKLEVAAFLPSSVIFTGKASAKGNFFFVYLGYGYYYNVIKDRIVRLPKVNRALQLKGQVLFVRNECDLWKYNDNAGKFEPVRLRGMPTYSEKEEEKPRFIWTPGMKAPVLAYKRDLWTLEGSANDLYLTPLCSACSPEHVGITSVQVWEQRGMIFLGSAINGLYILKRPFLRTIKKDTATEAGTAEYAQVELSPQVVTTATGLMYTAKGEKMGGEPEINFSGSSIYKDSKGTYWFFSGDTIKHYYPAGHRLAKIIVEGGAGKMAFAETLDRIFLVGDMEIADLTGDRYQRLYTLTTSSHTLKNVLSPDQAIEFAPGVLAIAGQKLILFNTQKPENIDTVVIPGLTVKVRALFKYGDYLFIGTYGQGFYIYKNGIVKKMPLDKNRYLSCAHCFLPDDKGFCWISTNHGLFKASLKALTAGYERNLNEIYYQYFGKDDGIFNTEFNGGCQPSGIRLTSGQFSFPTMNGIAMYDPELSHTPPPTGRLFIDEIETDSISVEVADSNLNRLPYTMKNIRFKLSLPEFGNPENIYFSYKLDPYNSGWQTQDITRNSTLQFGGLKPGNYKLYLRIRNGFEPDQFGMTEVSFRILEPWYHCWWFYLLCVCASVLLVGLLVKWRTATINRRKKKLQQLVDIQTRDIEAQSRQLEWQLNQLQKQQEKLEENNRIKARLIGIISHDMISPLKFLGFMGKKLRDGHASTPAAQETANFVMTVARELESLSLNMLNWIRLHYGSPEMKPEPFDLHQLLGESTEIPFTLATEKGLGFFNEVLAGLELIQYRQALAVIVYNLATNAVKYTAEGEIRIVALLNQHQLFLTVTDTGPGMDPKTVKLLNQAESIASAGIDAPTKTKFGYIIIRDLLRQMSGTLKVESTLNNGTSVTVSFPVRLKQSTT